MSGGPARGGPSSPEGLLLVDKPEGPTSHDIVAQARRALAERRIGHSGTLDPFASGLLLLAVGRATRLVQFLHDLPKEYVATARLGVQTTTDDPEGEVEEELPVPELDDAAIQAAMGEFLGEIRQRPPAFSAKKVAGVAAHRRARRGEEVELPESEVRIDEFCLLDRDRASSTLTFRVRCSTGTYIRSLGRDLGIRLGTRAHLLHLRRTRIGSWSVEDAMDGGRLEAALPGDPAFGQALVSPLDALAHLPLVALGPDEARFIVHGRSVRDAEGPKSPGLVRVEHSGRLLAVGEWSASGELRPKKVFGTLAELESGSRT